MDELDSKLRNLEELEAARAKEAWEKHVVSTLFWYSTALCSKIWKESAILERSRSFPRGLKISTFLEKKSYVDIIH